METSELLTKDKEMKRLLHFQTYASREPFIKSYKKGFKNYLTGDWPKCKEYLEKCLLMDPADGPSKVILNYIKTHDYKSKNVNWNGYRILTDK